MRTWRLILPLFLLLSGFSSFSESKKKKNTNRGRGQSDARRPASIITDVVPTYSFEYRSSNPKEIKFTSGGMYQASIPEITPIGSTIKCDLKMGVYTQQNKNLDYIITSGNEQGVFKVGSRQVSDFHFMDIRTNKRLNRESTSSYVLTVVVQDRSTKRTLDRTKISISVADSNDNRPIFLNKTYLVTISEDVAMHTSIAKIRAVDADVGPNGLVYYSFKEKTSAFAINPTSGIVTVTRKLDSSRRRHHKITIVARDRALPPSKPKSSRNCRLIVNVQPVNQFSPEITVITQLQNVSEGVARIVYATIQASDRDKGANGDIDRVEITSGNLNEAFRIKSSANDFSIEVIKPLDREVAPFGYNVTLTAFDRGSPQRNGSFVLKVIVEDVNDNQPVFNQSRYKVSMSEFAPSYSPVLRVYATDKDTGLNGNIVYAITTGNELGKFEVNSNTGQIYTKGALDFETKQRFDLVVAAIDGGPGGRKLSTVQVLIQVLDANDHSPVFQESSYKKDLYEDLTPGTSVLSVHASDADSGNNGLVHYSIANMEAVPFSIETKTGIIKTTTNLDRDKGLPELIKLRVRASDFGTPMRREAETLVTMRVKEMNDNAPVLKQFKCNIQVGRDAPPGVLITTVMAVDIDISDKKESLTYKFTFGNTGRTFQLDPQSGEIRTAKNLRVVQREFTLIIKASDSIQESADTHPVVLKISIVSGRQARKLQNHVKTTCIDSPLFAKAMKIKREQSSIRPVSMFSVTPVKLRNRHTPVFRSHDQSVRISEGTPVGTVIMQLMATDQDKSYNGLVLYSIVKGDTDSVFTINMFTGKIVTVMPLDRETTASYTLNISASDCGRRQKSAYTTIKVTVLDINDNKPAFDQATYKVTLPENVTVGQTVTHVHATDTDEGSNGFITYQLVSDFGGKFRIDRLSGVISVAASLDFEDQNSYHVQVQALDGSAKYQKVGNTEVLVTISDINDNAPVVKPHKFNLTVPEDLLVEAIVTSIHATDPDSGLGGQVWYALAKGIKKFKIDAESGVIRLRRRLDYERQSSYNITVQVTDMGSPVLSTDIHVIVNILDVNENSVAPVFTGGDMLQASVYENRPPGTVVLPTKATDQDSWYLKYAIIDGTGVDKFVIDQDTGAIRTTGKLDHEVADHYWLAVQAKDGEVHSLYTNIPVLINVLDINDESPYFTPSIYYPAIAENERPGTSVVQVTARDPDSDGSLLRYSITKGNDDNNFVINPKTGLITTVKKLNHEVQSEYLLTITATDGGSPPKYASTSFIVKVTDENDHEPLFTESQYIIGVSARSASQKPVELYQVLATDEDSGPNADLSYSIVSGNRLGKFTMDAKSGVIFTSSALSDGDSFDLTVNAADNGLPKLSSNVTVVIDVTMSNPPSLNAPQFWENSHQADIQEDKELGGFVVVLGAEDPDNDQITYHIVSGNLGNKFTVDRYGGFITVAQKLDREAKRSYTLNVEASDGHNTAIANVKINVLDVNDNAPQPTRREYRVQVSENSPKGVLVTTVQATDPDAGVNGEVEYSIVGTAKVESASLFKIQSTTGKILTTSILDYENMKEHVLIVKASDRGSPKKETHFSVVISVKDVNDHKPLFVKSLYECEVSINAKIGEPILKVVATDNDDGANAKLRYSIVSGISNQSLTVDRNSGVLRVGNKLSAKIEEYSLKIQAADGGEPSLASQVIVKVKVRGIVKIFSFTRPSYEATIPENSPPDQAIVSVVYDGIMPVYEMLPASSPCWKQFQVQRQTGLITNKISFDAETMTHCKLKIRGTSTDRQQSTTRVTVKVLDKNDNAPVFAHDKFVGHVKEGMPQISAIMNAEGRPLVARASDRDSSDNNKLTYEIVESSARSVFNVHPASGAITTAKKLDFEEASVYKFQLKVTDSGSPRLSAFADVEVKVDDVNDIAPVFSATNYHATVYLPAYTGTRVAMVTATDGDSASLTKLTFLLANTAVTDKFMIDAVSGIVTVKNASMIQRDIYRLKMIVSDGNFTAHARMSIRCEDVPSSRLRFSQKNYTASIVEGTSLRKQLVTIRALGYSFGETITFSIINPSELFEIVPSTGIVSILPGKQLDREQIDAYKVVVQARDGNVPPSIAQSFVHVAVEDMNDNAPVFVGAPYFIVLQLGVTVGTKVGRAHATDADIGTNADLRYVLKGGGDGRFKIEHKTGYVIVRRSLDDVTVPKLFTLIVEAHDKGRPRLSAEAVVKIKVVDKETPVFDKPIFNEQVTEDVAVGTQIIQVLARSPSGSSILYSITNGDPVNQFSIDFKTGVVTVAASLDYETITKYKLVVRATDANTAAHSEVAVDVTVTDVNDIAPVFNRPLYLTTISEDISTGKPVISVMAIDGDSGVNKNIIYTIQNVSRESQFFKIDKTSGVISVLKKLDYEDRVVHEMIVVASDEGVPSLTGESRVRIVLEDANDNPPRFEKTMYAASILGNAGPGHFVTRVLAMDPDDSDVSKLQYSIVSGRGRQHFRIDSGSGVITLSTVVGIKRGKVYGLDVSVTDRQHSTTTKVRVIIGDTNDHSPVFSKDVYQVAFHENYPEGTFVSMVTATDLDSGKYARLTYSIDSVDAMRRFRIDTDTGMIYSRLMFDRENGSQAIMSVPVRATDGGGRFGFCVVEVGLLDENDNQPKFEFKQYETTISRSAPTNTPVLMTSATDEDATSNSALIYAILGHQTPPVFSIEPTTGVIKVARTPEVKVYNFFVLVKDGGNPQLRSIASVKITVLEKDVRILQFERSKYDVEVPENAPMGKVAASLRLVIPSGPHPNVHYSVIRGNSPSPIDKKFGVDSTGRVKVVGSLNYEGRKRYVMIVEANASTIHQIARTAVVVRVTDINDNKPSFVSNPYLVSIPENINMGSKVLRVFAEDLDSGSNGAAMYELATDNKTVKEKFDIDRNTGWITTKGLLDRETVPLFEFRVRATDKGATVQLSSHTTVRAVILDVNDSPPKFSHSEFRDSIKEDALIGQSVTTVIAQDADLNSDLFYFILSGDPQAKFGIERKTGVIFVHGALDRESVSSYDLNVSASDGLFTGFTQVKIEIEDANDNAPVCSQSIYVIRIPENSPLGGSVLTVGATDADTGINAHLNYSVYGQGVGKFTVNRHTGVMTTLVELDRESRPYYNFMVSAADIGGQACFSNVTIHLDDVNDNKPAFSQSRYLTSVYEDAPLKKVLLQVKADDPDVGLNRKLAYSLITDAGGTFEIETGTGIISLRKHLNRELKENYTLQVRAQDSGTPSLWSLVTVEVQVLNINDVPPEFAKSMYRGNISENAPRGTKLLTVHAISRESNHDVITYKILRGVDSGLFRINSKTGAIRTDVKLDYEKRNTYMLTIQASDVGPPVLTTTASVKIDVTDANDNKPVFSEAIYTAKVDENSAVDTFALQVFATDRDSGDNSDVRYSIGSGNEAKKFKINTATGAISVAGSIDREVTAAYQLVVRAQDQGTPALSSDAEAKITIGDVNDNPPEFSKSNLTVPLPENSPMYTSVIHLRPHDKDGPGSGAPFIFTLISGDTTKFTLHPNGLITKAGPVFHKDGQYPLRILVVDIGHPPQSTELTVNVKIVESVNHPPTVNPLTIYVNLYGSNFNGGVIGRVKGTDRDGHQLRFSIVSPKRRSPLRITAEGTVRTKDSISTGTHNLNVSVTDGRYTVYSSVTVVVSDITNDIQGHSITLRLASLTAGTFVEMNFEKCKKYLGHALKVPPDNVHIWSMQSSDEDLDVVVAIRKRHKGLFSPSYVDAKLNATRGYFESQVGVRIASIGIGQCQLLDCPKYLTCSDMYKPENKQVRVMSDGTSYISYEHSRSHACTCKDKTRGCASAIQKCATNPCASGYKCTDFPQGYQCKCVDPTKCHMDTTGCEDKSCIKGTNARTFGGNSYIRYRLKETFDQPSRSVGLAIKTVKSEGTLVFAAGQYDYSILEIVKGFIQLRFDFGSGAGVVSIDWSAVNDGKWHHVLVERQGNHATVILDHGKHQASGQSPGRMRILNLDGNSIYFGAKVTNSRIKRSNGQGKVVNGFNGCMQNLNLNGKDLPMTGSNNHATGYPSNAGRGCRTSGACRQPNTCPRGSQCIETFSGRLCECLQGHSGPDCKPYIKCSGEPCQNQGICFDHAAGYRCLCPKGYTGYQCQEFIGACASSPCKNGGTCMASQHGDFLCQCAKGVSGANCEIDTRPCASSPCFFNGNCSNHGNDFKCQCPNGLSGKRCEQGFHCNRLPCLNGGSCEMKKGVAMCLCPKGYKGLDCSVDVDECTSDPCKNGGQCINTKGSFRCNCSSSSHGGDLCTTVLANIAANKSGWPLGRDEIIGIGVVLAVILLLVLIIIIFLRRRAKKKRKHNTSKTKSSRNSVLKVSPPVVGADLDSPNPPTPPPRQIPSYDVGEPPEYDSEDSWRRRERVPPQFGTLKSLDSSDNNIPFHWDYTDIPSDLVYKRTGTGELCRERSASFMGVPDNSMYPDAPEVPERPNSGVSSHSSGVNIPEVPERPRNYRPSESDDQHLEVPQVAHVPKKPADYAAPKSKGASRYSMDSRFSEYSDMTDADYCRSVGGDSNYPDIFKGRFPGPPREPYPESVDTFPVGSYAPTMMRDSELGSVTDGGYSDDDLERVYLGNSRMEACDDSNTYLHSENASEDDGEVDDCGAPDESGFHQTLQAEIREMMDQLEELKHESEL